ncbi:MAG: 2-oxo acid dehydrogenase subunit E2 [DPANN group archaeon]|nr:2-oxo acid dehydrogenase subunit E2 [DPANN group archaeon]
MAKEFKFPDVGEGIAEGDIVKWLVKEGDNVSEHQAIVKIETSKAIVDIPSPTSGTVLKINFKEGENVKVGQVLAVIGDRGEKTASHPSTTPATETGGQQSRVVQQQTKAQPVIVPRGVAVVGELEEAKTSGAVCDVCRLAFPNQQKLSEHVAQEHKTQAAAQALATPAVRALARQYNLDLAKVSGTGPASRITEADVKKAVEFQQQVKPETPRVVKKYDFFGYVDRVPLKGMRKSIADNMVKSLFTAPHVTHMDEIDVTDLWAHREKEKKSAEQNGVKLTFMPYVIKAVSAALKNHPYLNAAMDSENQEIILKKYYNIGFAVATEDGLLVPVVKAAERKGLRDIAKEVEGLAQKARDRTIDLMQMRGGTFTITNIGSVGGLFATPIINYPESAILALGKIHDKVAVVDGKIQIRKALPVSLAFDHRILDGAEAAAFVNEVKKYLEDVALLIS